MKILKPEGLFSPPRYYPGVKAGNLIFTAGRILAEGGATLQDVVYVHTYL